MLSSLKNLSNKLSGSTKKQVVLQVVSTIESEVNVLFGELESIPEGRLPSPKIRLSIESLRDRLDAMLVQEGMRLSDLPESVEIDKLEVARRVKLLDCYAELIPKDDDVRPFATFFEFRKALEGVPPIGEEQVKQAYHRAVRALFTHPYFQDNLLDRIDGKIAILGKKDRENDLERQRVVLFVENYFESKAHNRKLGLSARLEAGMGELEAIIYLQTQAEVLAHQEVQPTPALINFINYWAVYLDKLSPEEQKKRQVFVDAVNLCSDLNKAIQQKIGTDEKAS